MKGAEVQHLACVLFVQCELPCLCTVASACLDRVVSLCARRKPMSWLASTFTQSLIGAFVGVRSR